MEQMTLFEHSMPEPLAARLRPQGLHEYIGQEHLLGKGRILRRLIESDQISSMIFWGPPGVGKTTLARIIANKTKAAFIDFSAVTSGIKEIRTVMQQAEQNRRYGEKTIVFVDEIHRFNKAQQDAFLPYVEKGSIVLIGATTENPSFEINSALLSRCRVFVLKALAKEELLELLKRTLEDPRGFGGLQVKIAPHMLEAVAGFANGDARTALSVLEMAVLNGDTQCNTITVSEDTLEQCISRKSLLYDKKGEEHYNLISALHKSMRNSDPDAAVYWLARMLEAGEEPLYIARRVIRFASEDIGLAYPMAVPIVKACVDNALQLGLPEAKLPLAEAVILLATAPKSNSVVNAIGAAMADVRAGRTGDYPRHLQNVHADGAGFEREQGYLYPHLYPGHWVAQQYLPDAIKDHVYYEYGPNKNEQAAKAYWDRIKGGQSGKEGE